MIMASLPYGKMRHLFSFLLGAFLLQFTIGKQWIHHVIAVVISYMFMLILPPKVTKTVVPTFIMLYVTLGHLHRQFVNYLGWDLDFTGSHMVLAMKLYSLAYNLYDGDLIRLGKETRATTKCAHLAVTGVPGIIEFLGYTLIFPPFLLAQHLNIKFMQMPVRGRIFLTTRVNPKERFLVRSCPL
jgi:Predicted membrane protein